MGTGTEPSCKLWVQLILIQYWASFSLFTKSKNSHGRSIKIVNNAANINGQLCCALSATMISIDVEIWSTIEEFMQQAVTQVIIACAKCHVYCSINLFTSLAFQLSSSASHLNDITVCHLIGTRLAICIPFSSQFLIKICKSNKHQLLQFIWLLISPCFSLSIAVYVCLSTL